MSHLAHDLYHDLYHILIRADYLLVMKELGVTDEYVRAQSEDYSDHRDFPVGEHKPFVIGSSEINHIGAFADQDLSFGDVIATMWLDDGRTELGRRVNHSPFANTFLMWQDGRIILVAARSIYKNEELTLNYRQTPAAGDLRSKLN